MTGPQSPLGPWCGRHNEPALTPCQAALCAASAGGPRAVPELPHGNRVPTEGRSRAWVPLL